MKSIKVARLKKKLRQRGLGKYRSKEIRNLPKWKIDHYLYILSIVPGDIFNDCDGFNHRVADIVWIDCWASLHKGVPVLSIQFEREDGLLSCGCPSGPDRPRSVRDIQKFYAGLVLDDEMVAKQKENGWWTDLLETMRKAMLNGDPITNEQGLPLFSVR